MKTILYTLLLVPTLVLGQVKFIEKDTPAPYSGFLYTREESQKLRLELIEADFNRKELDALKKQNELLMDMASNWRTQSKQLSDELVRKERNSFWQNTLYFSLGALLTGAIAIGTYHAVK